MKHGMPTRKSIGKVSSFLKSFKRKKQGATTFRSNRRNHLSSKAPNSTKISIHSISLSQVFRTGKYNGNFGRKGIVKDIALNQ